MSLSEGDRRPGLERHGERQHQRDGERDGVSRPGRGPLRAGAGDSSLSAGVAAEVRPAGENGRGGQRRFAVQRQESNVSFLNASALRTPYARSHF